MSFLLLIPRTGAASAALDEKEVKDIAQKVFRSVVKVEARNSMRKVATGVVVDKDGHIVTTALVSPRDEEIFITTSEGEKVEANFLGMDSMTHLALIQVKGKKLPPLETGSSQSLGPGSWVGVVGFSPENQPAITQGIVSSIGQDKLRLNIWVVPGSSGSPVVDKKGHMVGLLRGIYSDEKPVVFEFREREMVGSGYVFSKAEAPSSGMALAVPVDVMLNVVSDIKKKGKVERGWLGVSIVENEAGRVEIVNVEKDSPAELAKLEEGDFVLQFDNKTVVYPDMLAREIKMRKPGENVTVKIERDGKPMDVKVKLGEYSEKDILQEFEVKFPRLFPSQPTPPKVPQTIRPPKPPETPESKELLLHWENRKYIGLYLENLTEELSEFFGVKEGGGLLVSKIIKDSPAEKAGLKVGDVLIKADGKKLEEINTLTELIQDKEKGDKILIEFLRDKKLKSVNVEIEEEEGKGMSFVSPEWDTYAKSLENYRGQLSEQIEKWGDQYSEKYANKLKKMNEEISRIYEKVSQEAIKKSGEVNKKLKVSLRNIRGVRV